MSFLSPDSTGYELLRQDNGEEDYFVLMARTHPAFWTPASHAGVEVDVFAQKWDEWWSGAVDCHLPVHILIISIAGNRTAN